MLRCAPSIAVLTRRRRARRCPLVARAGDPGADVRLLRTLAALTSALLVPRPARADDVTAQVDALYSRPDGSSDRDALVAVTARMFRLVADDDPRFAFVVEHDAVTEVKISVDGEAGDVRQRRGE
jgi:hypothetical protein